MEDVDVIVGRFGGEVVPDQALNRMGIGGNVRVLIRLREDRWEHLEAGNVVALVVGQIDTLIANSSKPDRAGLVGMNAERDGICPCNGEHPETAAHFAGDDHR
jgi:hypothetical protein